MSVLAHTNFEVAEIISKCNNTSSSIIMLMLNWKKSKNSFTDKKTKNSTKSNGDLTWSL